VGRFEPPADDNALHAWIAERLGYRIPRLPVCEGHAAPFEPLADLFFERTNGAVLWANRGGGKTLILALLAFLEALHKPGVDILGLGGSLSQAAIGFEYLHGFIERLHLHDQVAQQTSTTLRLKNGSRITVIPASTRQARGPHPHKLRCDEVDECPPDVLWAALQGPQSRTAGAGVMVTRSVALSSTLHKPYGTMQQLVDDHAQRGLQIYKWCYREVTQRCFLRKPGLIVSDGALPRSGTKFCPEDCPLLESCAGALRGADGYLPVSDVQQARRLNDRATWEVEWECERPSVAGSVYDPALVERAVQPVARDPALPAVIGVDWGYTNPTVILLAQERGEVIEVLSTEYHRRRPITVRVDRIAFLAESHRAKMVYADAAGADENAELRTLGVRVTPVSFGVHKDRGIRAIRAALEHGRLRIAPELREFIGEMKRYHYREGTEEIVKDDDHGPDALCALFRRYHRFSPEVGRTRLGKRIGAAEVEW